jgi:predicted amidohydrolase
MMSQQTHLETTRRGFLAISGSAVGGALVGPAVPVPACEPQAVEAHQKQAAKPVVIGLIQMRCGGDPGKNLDRAIRRIALARSKGAGLIVLPELFGTKYFCRSGGKHGSPGAKAAEGAVAQAKVQYSVPIDGKVIKKLAKAAKKNEVVLVGGSIFEKARDRYFNTSVVFGPEGKIIGMYRKTHIPHDPGFWEQHYFSPGDTGIKMFDTPVGKLAVLICYDQWFPEAARLAALQGAEIIVYPTAIGDVDDLKGDDEGNWREMWTSAQVGHAVCNKVFVAAVNRVGREGATTFWGGSFVADPCGRVLNQAGVAEEIVVVRCNLARVWKMRDAWGFFRERRPDMYPKLAHRLSKPGS